MLRELTVGRSAGMDVAPAFVPSHDDRESLFYLLAFVAALLLHAALILLTVLGLPIDRTLDEPQPIPVELVVLPPPPPKAVASQPPPPLAPPLRRESGGDPDLAPGKSTGEKSEAGGPPALPSKTEPIPTPLDDQAPMPSELAEQPKILPVPVPPPPRPEKSNDAATPSPAAPRPLAERPAKSELFGAGGGDRYLNALRDRIDANIVYPTAARSLRLIGTPIYEMFVDDDGRLIGVNLLRSTGEGILDQAGLDAIKRSAPFPPPPPDAPRNDLGVIAMEIALPIAPR